MKDLLGTRIGDRYVIERVLGSGGMGVVAVGRDPKLGQRVAIKFLRPEYASNVVLSKRFQREARVAAKVKSAHFVRVFDLGQLATGVPYIVMELLVGRDLGDELRARGPLPIEEAIDYVLQASAGIAEIHALGIVHRDLKPSNLFLSEAAGTRLVKVLDFGISKESGKGSPAPLTGTEALLGTPQYMSPEQVKASKDVDLRSDLWAVGVILYELLTGQRPFVSDEGGAGEVFAKILFVEPAKPSTHRPDIPAGLEAAIMKCLVFDREKRFATVGELALALQPFAASNSVHRVEAVKQALRTPIDSELDEEAESPTKHAATVASGAGVNRLAATEIENVRPRDRVALAATTPASPAPVLVRSEPPATGAGTLASAGNTAMTSSSVVDPPLTPRHAGRWLIALFGGMAIAVFAFALYPRSTPPAPSVEPSSPTASSGHAATEPPSASAFQLAPAPSQTPSTPSETTSAKPVPGARTAISSKGGLPNGRSSAPSTSSLVPVAPPTTAPTSTELIFDRK